MKNENDECGCEVCEIEFCDFCTKEAAHIDEEGNSYCKIHWRDKVLEPEPTEDQLQRMLRS